MKSVGRAILSLCFARKKRTIENIWLEGFKEEKLKTALSDMLDNGGLSYSDFFRIQNFLDVALLAD